MCQRLTLPDDIAPLKDALAVIRDDLGDYAPRWNVTPTTRVPVLMKRAGERTLDWMRWGLIPSWATDERNLYSTFIAPADMVESKPAFRDAWNAGRRCLIIASAYIEWRCTDKQPFAIARSDGQPLFLAGLWEEPNARLRETQRSCTIVTTAANEFIANFHDRMPVVIEPADCVTWLGEVASIDPATLMKPAASGKLTSWPVDRRIADPAHQDRAIAAPIRPTVRV